MTRWNIPGIPHKGWQCETVYDVREDGASQDDTAYEVCQMCGNVPIRFVHVMSHSEYPEDMNVGCICAQKMSDDYVGPERSETALRNRAVRRKKWLTRTWRVSSKGNDFLNVDGYNIVISPDKYHEGKWGYRLDGKLSRKRFSSKDQAKLAAFDEFWENNQSK